MSSQAYLFIFLSVHLSCLGCLESTIIPFQVQSDIDKLKIDFLDSYYFKCGFVESHLKKEWTFILPKEHKIQVCFKCLAPLKIGSSAWFSQIYRDLRKQIKNSSNSDVADGGPIFTEKLKSWTEVNERRILFSHIISLYLKMFENIDTSKTHVRNVHEYLLAKKSNLANDYKKINDIMELAKLPMSDLKIQRKAINELFPLLQKLDSPTARSERRRRQNSRGCKC
ncbi:interferon gamma [Alligator mississippiensis]|uniref:interferon gamma n=1 Tax=Alligator mississippiensis TaxID=8496 RepID=UPI002877F5C3|nr:interferon gamma [Alligator mississippiensis]